MIYSLFLLCTLFSSTQNVFAMDQDQDRFLSYEQHEKHLIELEAKITETHLPIAEKNNYMLQMAHKHYLGLGCKVDFSKALIYTSRVAESYGHDHMNVFPPDIVYAYKIRYQIVRMLPYVLDDVREVTLRGYKDFLNNNQV